MVVAADSPDATMVSEYDTSFTDEHVYTTDQEAIRNWAEARDAIPVDVGRDGRSDADAESDPGAAADADAGEDTGQRRRGGVDDYRFVRREDHEVADVEESWESFVAAFEEDDRALVLGEDPDRTTDRGGDEDIATHEFHPREALTDSPAEELEDRQPPSEDS